MARDIPHDEKGRFALKLTPELAKSLVEGVRIGLFDAQNALKHGIDVTSLKSWVDRGIDEDAEEPYKSFAEAYIKASIALEEGVINTILTAADEYERRLESVEEYDRGGDDVDSSDSEFMPGGAGSMRKTKKQLQTIQGDWKAAAWYAEKRWPLRWGSRQPEGGPKEALKLPDAPLQRRRKVEAMVRAPPPELIKALRDAGFELVRRDKAS